MISVRAHFERFPATVKGAFVIRGEDSDPHQVVFREARVLSVGGRDARRLAMTAVILDVAPRTNVFVPFELSVTDLEPGWYGLECDLEVDGTASTLPGGRRFVVAWPRSTVRRGQVRVDRRIALSASAGVFVGTVECGGDSIKIGLDWTNTEPWGVRLSADGSSLEVLESEFDPQSGRQNLTAYPLLRTHQVLRIEFQAGRGRSKATGPSIDVPLR